MNFPLIIVLLLTHFSLAQLPLGRVDWRSVTNRFELEASINEGTKLVTVKIDNGTEYLHLGGDLNEFHPIVVNPTESTPSSDLTLRSLLTQLIELAEQGVIIGLHISFVNKDIIPMSVEVLRSTVPPSGTAFPILVEANVLAADPQAQDPLLNPRKFIEDVSQVKGLVPILGWSTYHGMDKIWKKIEDDAILIKFQVVRVKHMVEELNRQPEKIKNQDVRFLDLLLKKVEQTHPNSFTVLALTQLKDAIVSNGHHKVEEDPTGGRRPYQPPRSNPIREILPDYYLQSQGYTEQDVDRMQALSEGLERVGFVLRAGMIRSEESVRHVARLVSGHTHRFLIVNHKPTDKEGLEDTDNLLAAVGEERVLLELEHRDGNKDGPRIPEPKEPRGNSRGSTLSCVIFTQFCMISIGKYIF